MPAGFLSRQQRFDRVGSTNDVVRGWLGAGTAEVALAVADEQTAGRGRDGRAWQAPPGAALLLSLGFRPVWLEPERTWRLPATIGLAMADAAEEVAGLGEGQIRLKWPNDLVVEDAGAVRKLGGILGESEGLGSADPRVVVGIGINADWPRNAFPADLAAGMSSLLDASAGRPIDRALLLDAFLSRLEVRVELLREGRFDVADWTTRQVTTGRDVEVHLPDGTIARHRALGVDVGSGALVVEDRSGGERQLHVGEISHVRLPAAPPVTARV